MEFCYTAALGITAVILSWLNKCNMKIFVMEYEIVSFKY